MKNRSKDELTAAILKAAAKGETRTKIMYMAMLGRAQSKIYLDSLIKSGLVHEVNDGDKLVYKVTPKGLKFLSYYNQMKALLPLVNDDTFASIVA